MDENANPDPAAQSADVSPEGISNAHVEGPPPLRDRLTADELPDALKTVNIDEVKTLVKEMQNEAVEAARSEFRTQMQRMEAQRAEQERRRATEQQDIDYYRGYERRRQEALASGDADAIRKITEELVDKDTNAKYLAGASKLRTEEQVQQQRTVLQHFVDTSQKELSAAGMGDFMPATNDPAFAPFLSDKLAPYDGKGGIFAYAIDYGKQMGFEEGKKIGLEEGARLARIETGKGNPAVGATPKPAAGQHDISTVIGLMRARREGLINDVDATKKLHELIS